MRKANYNDIKNIAKILVDAKTSLKEDGIDQWQNDSPNMFLIGSQIQRGNAYVYEDGDVVAYAFLSEDFEPTYGPVRGIAKGINPITIHTFCVAKDFKKKGVASKFFDEIIEFAKTNGKDSLRIDTHEDNFKMRGLIDKKGFEYLGVIFINDNSQTKERLAYELLL